MNAYRNYNTNTSALSKNLEKLSSGYKINRAGDDAAGLAISEKMRAQITGLSAAQKNVKDGISLVKTAEGAMQEVQDMLNRMVALATQASNGTYQDEVDRENLQAEIDQLNAEIDRIADSANFNGIKLLDGSLSKTGGKSVTTKFALPDVGTTLGVDTVLYAGSTASPNGTSFSVDLHNRVIHNGSKAEFTIDTGDIKITLTGNKVGAAAGSLSASQIVNLFTKASAASLANAGFTMKVSVAGKEVNPANLTFGSSGLVIKNVITADGVKVGDVRVNAGAGGNNRITFTQVNPPANENQIWKPASFVRITFDGSKVPAGSVPQALKEAGHDNLISSHVGNVISFENNAPITFQNATLRPAAGSLSAKTATVASTTSGVAKLSANVNITAGTSALVNLAKANGEFKLSINSAGTKATIKVGNTTIATADVAASKISASGSMTITFSGFGTVKLSNTSTAASLAVSAIVAQGSIGLGISVQSYQAGLEGTVTAGTGFNKLEEQLKTKSAVLTGDITVTTNANGTTCAIKVDGKTVGLEDVKASYALVGGSTVITLKGADGSEYLTIKAAGATAAVKAAFISAADVNNATKGLKIGDFDNTTTDKTELDRSDFGNRGSVAVDVLKTHYGIASDGSGNLTSTTVDVTSEPEQTLVEQLSGVSQLASLAALGGLASTITQDIATFTMNIPGIGTVTINKINRNSTASAALSSILRDINQAAATAAYNAYQAYEAGDVESIEVYSNFRFVDGNGDEVQGLAAGDIGKYKLVADKLTISKKDAETNTGAVKYANYDHNVSTTNIERVDLNGKERLASTYFEVNKDKIKDGAQITIGNTSYTFSTDDKYKGNNGLDGNVYIGDLVDSSGKLKNDDAMTQAMERLTNAAKDNETYTVGYDGERITVTQRTDWTNDDHKADFDLSTMEGVAKSLGFTSAAVKGNGGLVLQIGDTADSYNQLAVEINDLHADALGVGGNIDISTQKGAQDAIQNIKNAINTVSSVRGRLGATQNRLEHTSNNLSVMAENIQDAESSIRDTDVAEEMMAYTKNNILVQSAQAMLAQANQVPQGVLQLLG